MRSRAAQSTGSAVGLVIFIAIATPAALGLESLLRWLFFGPEIEEVRSLLEPLLTPIAWLLALVATAAALGGLLAQRSLAAWRSRTLPSDAPGSMRQSVHTQVFLMTSSIAQVPVVIATLALMLGASSTPVLIALAISTASVLLQGTIYVRSVGAIDGEGAGRGQET